MESFFSENYTPPTWLKKKLSRRGMLKSAAGISAVGALHHTPISAKTSSAFERDITQETWATLDAVLLHLLPVSKTGPSAQDIQATLYLYNLVHQQPTAQDEIDFIYKGVGWLNGYTKKHLSRAFTALNQEEKETTLRSIGRSRAGENWLSMLISNLFEAMLAPPSYGGNPNGVGWQWLAHQPGFPLPPEGKRYYELPKRSKVKAQNIAVTFIDAAPARTTKIKKKVRKA
ncbi:gluconate 2-dehydrogenase subunit 3 family protein [Thalassotalea fusca]